MEGYRERTMTGMGYMEGILWRVGKVIFLDVDGRWKDVNFIMIQFIILAIFCICALFYTVKYFFKR